MPFGLNSWKTFSSFYFPFNNYAFNNCSSISMFFIWGLVLYWNSRWRFLVGVTQSSSNLYSFKSKWSSTPCKILVPSLYSIWPASCNIIYLLLENLVHLLFSYSCPSSIFSWSCFYLIKHSTELSPLIDFYHHPSSVFLKLHTYISTVIFYLVFLPSSFSCQK